MLTFANLLSVFNLSIFVSSSSSMYRASPPSAQSLATDMWQHWLDWCLYPVWLHKLSQTSRDWPNFHIFCLHAHAFIDMKTSISINRKNENICVEGDKLPGKVVFTLYWQHITWNLSNKWCWGRVADSGWVTSPPPPLLSVVTVCTVYCVGCGCRHWRFSSPTPLILTPPCNFCFFALFYA